MHGFTSYLCTDLKCTQTVPLSVPKDPVAALRYMADAADGGEPTAWYYFGLLKLGYGGSSSEDSSGGRKGGGIGRRREEEAQKAFLLGASLGHTPAIYRAILGWMRGDDKDDNCIMALNAARSLVDRTGGKYWEWAMWRKGEGDMDGYQVAVNLLSRMGFERASVLAGEEAERRGESR